MAIFDFMQQRNNPTVRGIKERLLAATHIVHQLGASFTLHQGTMRAAALTYYTMLSLVPLLAIAFSVLKGLGAQNALEPLLSQMAGDSQEIVSRIVNYVNNTNVKSLGGIGLLFLLYTAVSLLEYMEEAFNAIWGVSKIRPLQRRFSDYLSVIIVGPILLLAATSITSGLQSKWLVNWIVENTYFGDSILFLFQMLPYISIWIATTFLYIFIPNTKVRFGSALLGGILAGTSWQITQWCYFYFQVGVANYNAIYGAMAALPVLLIWIYVSWLIVLFGLEIVYADQHRGLNPLVMQACSSAREVLALALMVQVSRHFRNTSVLPDSSQLADEIKFPLVQVEGALKNLADLKYLATTDSSTPAWLPAYDPDRMLVCELLSALRGELETAEECPSAISVAAGALSRGRHAERSALEGLSVSDLLESVDSPMKSNTNVE